MSKDVWKECSVSVDCHTIYYHIIQNWTFWRLPRNYWQADCFFQKTQMIDQSFSCNKEINEAECFSGGFEAGTLRLSPGKYIAFAIRLPLPSSQRQLSLQFLSSVKDTTRTHCTLPWEKVSEPRVLWVLTAIPCGTLIRWKYTVRWLYARSGKKSVMSRKLKNLTKTVVMKIKMNQCVFLTGLRLQLSSFPRWKMLLLLQGPNSHVHKVYLQAVSELCKDTPRTQGTILSEKISAEGVP